MHGVTGASLADQITQSQRDLGVTVPINFVTVPGVSLSAACFSKLRYDNDDAALCLSNLLAVGFQRFEVDLYWDDGRQVWSFCPAAIPAASSVKSRSPSSNPILSPSSDASGNSEPDGPDSTSITSNIVARQLSSTSTSNSSSTSSTSLPLGASSLGQALPSYSSLPDNPHNSLISIGP